jgi:hypothetical protein
MLRLAESSCFAFGKVNSVADMSRSEQSPFSRPIANYVKIIARNKSNVYSSLRGFLMFGQTELINLTKHLRREGDGMSLSECCAGGGAAKACVPQGARDRKGDERSSRSGLLHGGAIRGVVFDDKFWNDRL